MSGSLFFDLSNNANKLRKSYVNGFVDISGNVLIRNEHSLGFYKELVQKKPHYTLDSNGMKIYDVTDTEGNFSTVTDITTTNLKQLSGTSTNIATDFTNIGTLQTTNANGISTLVANLTRTDLSLNTLPNLDPSIKVTFGDGIDVTGQSVFGGWINQV